MAVRNDLSETTRQWGKPVITMADVERNLTLAWWGGHGVHAYDNQTGREVSFWNTGSFAVSDATAEQVRSSMEDHIESGEYP